MVEKEIVVTVRIPEGINFTVEGHNVTIKTDKGEYSREFKSHRLVLEKKGQDLVLVGSPVNKQTRALLNTVVAHLKNMIIGLKFGYKYTMKISYSHFPMTAEVKGNEVIIKNFIGEKFPRRAKIAGDAKVEIKGQDITITGNHLEEVSQTATNIEQRTKVKGKDIRRYTDGIYLESRENQEEVTEDFGLQTIRGRE